MASRWISASWLMLSIPRSEQHFDRLYQRNVGILKAVFFDLIGVSGEFLRVYGQIPALAMEIAVQPDCETIWLSNFVSCKLVTTDLCDIYGDLRT